MRPIYVLRSLSFSLALLASRPALAAGPADADALFDRGVAKMKVGLFEEACPEIEQSYALDPAPGTLFTLADCEVGRKRFANALRRYEEYLALYARLPAAKRAVQDQKNRPHEAKAQVAALAPKVAELTVVLVAGAPGGARVSRDGTALEAGALGVGVRVDPGEHVVSWEALGGEKKEVRVTLAAGEKKTVAPEFGGGSREKAQKVPVSGPSGVSVGAKATVVSGTVLAGVGLVLGGVLNGLARAKETASHQVEKPRNGICPGYVECEKMFYDLQGQKQTFAQASAVSFGVAGAGAVAGAVGVIYGLVSRKRGSSMNALVGPDRAGLSFSGSW